jgi:hypothetical protein
VPLCRGHHRALHRCGDTAAWWEASGFDCQSAARLLWRKAHSLPNNHRLEPTLDLNLNGAEIQSDAGPQ